MAQEIQFEKSLDKLEKIVQDLETGNIPLEEALKKYEEGVKLSRACQEKLTQAEKKIEILTRTLSGKLKKEPFSSEEEDEKTDLREKRSKKKAVEDEEDDEDLLF